VRIPEADAERLLPQLWQDRLRQGEFEFRGAEAGVETEDGDASP